MRYLKTATEQVLRTATNLGGNCLFQYCQFLKLSNEKIPI